MRTRRPAVPAGSRAASCASDDDNTSVFPIPRGPFVLNEKGHITRVFYPPEGWEGYGPVLPKYK